jgi:hypothetical protein
LRSTTFVFKILCTSIQTFGVIQFQTSAQQNKMCQARSAPRRRVATPSPRPRLGVCAVRRTRPPADLGSLLRMRRAPRLLGVLTGRAHAMDHAVPARCAPQTTGSSAAPVVRVPAEAAVPRPHPRGHALIITTKPPLFKPRVVPLLAPSLPPAAPSVPPPVNSHPCHSPVRLTFLAYSLRTLEACVVYLPGIARRRRSHSTPRPSPSATAVRRRQVPLRPNSEHPRALGELTLLPAPLHGLERRRPRRNWPSRAAPMAKGHIASPHLFLRVFL